MSTALDSLRGWYAASPPMVRKSVGKLVALLPADLKYGSTFKDMRQAIERAKTDGEFVQETRLKHLRELVSHAAQTDYYKPLLKDLPAAEDFTFADLAKLPILTKEELRENSKAFLAKPMENVDVASTSGSSGRPLTFYLDKNRGAKEFAYITHFWSRIGFDYKKSTRAVLRGVHFDNVDSKPWQYDAALKELRLSPFHMKPDNMDLFIKLMHDYKVDYIHGYPSSIMVLADYIIASGAKMPKSLKGILPVSEATLPHQLERLKLAFGQCRVTKYYGMSEKVLIAGQVEDDAENYEFEPLYGHAELVDDAGNSITQEGETGRIIGTGFLSMAMPLLRYDTEDVADFHQAASEQNGYRFGVKNIRGRWGEEYALGKNNELVSMSAINIHSEEYSKVHVFQLYQEVAGELTIKVVPKTGITHAMLQPFADEIQAKLGDVIHMALELVEEIPFNTANGKRKFIDQKINLEPFIKRAKGA